MNKRMILLPLVALLATGAACGSSDGDGDLAAFCEANATIDSADPFAATSPSEAQTITSRMREAQADGLQAAPSEVRDDVARVNGVFVGMLDELESADYDVSAVDPGALFADAATSDPEFEAALARVGAFAEEECDR